MMYITIWQTNWQSRQYSKQYQENIICKYIGKRKEIKNERFSGGIEFTINKERY